MELAIDGEVEAVGSRPSSSEFSSKMGKGSQVVVVTREGCRQSGRVAAIGKGCSCRGLARGRREVGGSGGYEREPNADE
jgi:hypothetical protein